MSAPLKPWQSTAELPPALPSTDYPQTDRYRPLQGYGQAYGMGSYQQPYGYGGGTGYGSYGQAYGGMQGYGMQGYGGMHGQYGMHPPREGPLMLLDQTVQILSSLTHLLDTTIMASHSSFMGVVGLMEQVGVLKSIVGGVVGLKWLTNFAQSGTNNQRRPNRTAVIALFLVAFFGVPWLLRKLESQSKRGSLDVVAPPSGEKASVEFARATHDYTARNPQEISFQQGDTIAITQKQDGQGVQWWRGKVRNGTIGYFPSSYVQLTQKKVDISYDAFKNEE